jgi:hypothetical protein
MKRIPTQFRSYRLPQPLDASLTQAAATAGVTQTAVLVRILADAVKRGDLPQPKKATDRRQLEFV